MNFILASMSPRRKELLKLAGLEFETIPSDVDETLQPELTPHQQVMALAHLKAETVAKNHPDKCVIASDTIVVLDNEILGKPIDESDAAVMLKKLSAKSHQVMTAVTIMHGNRQISHTFIHVTDVEFYDMSDEWIADYVKTGEPMDKAGAYGIQGLGFELVKRIDGDYYSVMGLPIAMLKRELRQLGLIK